MTEDSEKHSEEFLTPEEVAGWLKVPVPTLYGWRHRGGGPPASRVGRHLRYRRGDVAEWFDEQK
jgi:excisionase family DNA binding protein